jgi:hypothetical protein
MRNVTQERHASLTNKEAYLRSLNTYLENMPEHCMSDMEEMMPAQIVGILSACLAAASAYVALTSTVLSVKKDF